MARRKGASKLLTIGVLAAAGALIAFVFLQQTEIGRNNEFKRSIDVIAVDVISLTREYQAEEGKWNAGQYDNTTMLSIIDKYDPKYQSLIDRAENLDTPERYASAKSYLVNAIESERQSNLHLRNYIVTGSGEEYKKSIELVSLSLQYSADYDAAISAAG